LETINPDLAKQWHPIKNGDLTPRDVTARTGRKVWWLCEKGHEWEAKISNRSNGRNCPFCSGKCADAKNCLQIQNPDIEKQWHPFKNGDLTPSNITSGSRRKVWWQCNKGHEWESRVADRVRRGSGCPYCSGRRKEVKSL